jgi:hypothetical protein
MIAPRAAVAIGAKKNDKLSIYSQGPNIQAGKSRRAASRRKLDIGA